ncbi:MAG: hypothetical protein NZM35_06975 [Chitinophagales bacterium]|nr:hypothetical protein [Chitinophagales bacterium]MDW8419097.1 Glu/Leu/Phe/Val dehydrogenase [Chitinophagales bacterium]
MVVESSTHKFPSHVFNMLETMEHEQVVFIHDAELGLRGIIGIHDTTLGPALGGCRIWQYASESDALWDVLRLSRGMTYKSSISGINLGGGKAVIMANPDIRRDEKFWRRYGQFVEGLNGRYITAEDVGTSTEVMRHVMKETKYVTGKPVEAGGAGDPSPFTAYGVYLGIKASVKHAYGRDTLGGVKVAVQGVGHVGYYLVERLTREGARVFAADIKPQHLDRVVKEFNAIPVDADEIYDTDADVYAPCALGATVNDDTIQRLKCQIIAGAANNQLADENRHGQWLKEKGILYAPDFLINAGGVINCYRELHQLTENETMQLIEAIYDRTLQVYHLAAEQNVTTHEAAMHIARERIRKAKATHQNTTSL